MNIFATYSCPRQSARYLDNKRVIKMILESAQLLSTALRNHGLNAPYRSTHIHHPCTKWVCKSRSNYMWLLIHFDALCAEYTKRYDKIHKSYQYTNDFRLLGHVLPDIGLTEFANCAANSKLGIDYKHIPDVHLAYRLYLSDRWCLDVREPTWESVL